MLHHFSWPNIINSSQILLGVLLLLFTAILDYLQAILFSLMHYPLCIRCLYQPSYQPIFPIISSFSIYQHSTSNSAKFNLHMKLIKLSSLCCTHFKFSASKFPGFITRWYHTSDTRMLLIVAFNEGRIPSN